MTRGARAAAVLLASCLVACGGAQPRTDHEERGAALRYELVLEDSLRAMRVSICSDATLAARFRAIHRQGSARFVHAEVERRDGSRAALPGPVLNLEDRDDWSAIRCVHYEIQLVSGGGDPNAPLGFVDAVYAPTSSWLWAPEPRQVDARYELTLSLPEGARSSSFFPRDPDTGRFVFGEAAFDYITYAAFGNLEIFPVAASGGCIEVAAIAGTPPVEALTGWIESAADAASRSLGHLPTDRVSVIALPIGRRGEPGDPLAFGMAAHGERPSLLAFVWSDASPESLRHDWVAVHELSHLGHAFMSGESAWLTEGIATYYETILRARAGWVSAETALEQLDRGLRRGERGGTGRTLHQESGDRHRTGAYDRVYWAGAAIALSIDIALREEGSSLDQAMERVHPLRGESMTDMELLLAMDGGSEGTATRVARRWTESSAFPDLTEPYRALGMVRAEAGLHFEEHGRGLREILLNESPALASNPPECRF